MRRKPHQGQPERVRLALDLLKRGVRLVLHLNVKDLDAVEPHGRGLVDALRDRDPPRSFAELPERIRRDADRVWPRRTFGGRRRSFLARRSHFGGTARKSDHRADTQLPEKSPAVQFRCRSDPT